MSFTIKLYNISDENNKLNKTLKNAITYDDCLIKENTSIIDPIIKIVSNDLHNINYAYIKNFNRYYYVNDIVSLNNNLWELHLHVDVLMTYKEQILKLNAIIDRYEKSGNLYLNDNEYPIQQNSRVQIYNFDKSFSNEGKLLLTVSGGD